jgi:hypothetical protein
MSEARNNQNQPETEQDLGAELEAQDMSESFELDDGTSFTLADIAGTDLSQVDEVRFVTWPVGTYRWSVCGRKYTTQTVKDGKKDAIIDVEIKCREVKAWVNPKNELKQEEWIGRSMHMKFFVRTGDGVGRLKAFLKDIGYPIGETRPVEQWLQLAIQEEKQFIAPVTHSKQGTTTYANINNQQIKKVG